MSYTGSAHSREAMLVCGDFNIEPLSPIYEFVVVGDLDYEGLPQNELSGQGRSGGRRMPPDFIPPSAEVTSHCLLSTEHKRRSYRKRSFNIGKIIMPDLSGVSENLVQTNFAVYHHYELSN